jgi:hypothetical protein
MELNEKPVKVYTQEVIIDMTKRYKEQSDSAMVSILAKELGVSDRSVIAKLSSLGIYVKKAYLTKQGELPVPKSEYIDRIGKLLDIDPCIMDSLEKVTKQCLVLMEARIKELSE